MFDFDVVVIGSGPGGYVCAIKLAQLGLKTAIVEKYSVLGGTCLNVGCIPSKAYLDSSERFFSAQHTASHGIEVTGLKLHWDTMQARVQKVVKQTGDGINFLMSKNKITVFQGVASFVDLNSIVLSTGNKKISAKNFVIATGSKPQDLPNIKIDKKRIISSTEALKLPSIPKSLLVIGAGAIGLEMSSVFARLGSKVQIFEYADTIIPTMDADLGKELSKTLKKEGIEIHTSVEVKSVVSNETEVALSAKSRTDNTEFKTTGDYILLAVGRRAYTQGLGLEHIEIQVDERGKIPVNKYLQTKHSHIYALGDVIAGPMLAHKAEEEGVFVAEVIAGQKPHINYALIPGVVYTWPEVAAVGATETELKKNSIEYKKGVFPFKALGRSRASDENFGMVKVLAHAKTDEILGVHMMGPRVADLIMQAATAMEYRASAEDIARICHAHPTYSEAFKEAAYGAWSGKYLHL
jgi:dihydrolipoamide dehydrogenase